MCPRKLKWSAERELNFVQHLSSAPAQTHLSELALNIRERPDDIEHHVNDIYDIIYEAANVDKAHKYSKKKVNRRGISKPTPSPKINKQKNFKTITLSKLSDKNWKPLENHCVQIPQIHTYVGNSSPLKGCISLLLWKQSVNLNKT